MERQVDVAFVARPAVGVAGLTATATAAAVGVRVRCAILCVGIERDGGSGFRFICSLLYGPLRVAIEGESVGNALIFLPFGLIGGWDDGGTTSERSNRREFVLERCVRVEVDVLVGVCGFAVDIK